MRILCDHCESAAAILFCAADEAALCHACDEKVHMCNKLASRHVRVGLAKPTDFPRCDICENAPAFFYCEVDGSSLCLQCDVSVHVGGKRRHVRYLLHRQRVEFPGDITLPEANSQAVDKINSGLNQTPNQVIVADIQQQDHRLFSLLMPDTNSDAHGKMEKNLIDLNIEPLRLPEQPPNDN